MNNFHYGLSLLETLYGITIPEETYEEIALQGWNLIGNKRSKIYKYSVKLDCNQNSIELPCNCDSLEAVTTNWEDFAHVDTFSPNEVPGSFITEQYIEQRKHFKQPLYAKGKFVNYERVGNTLYFTEHHPSVIHILYRGLVLDNDGLPEITDKEARALATYCAYITKFKEAIATGNGNIATMAAGLEHMWKLHCDQARTDHDWTQNDYDEILDAQTNFDRKIHNISFKLTR